jgi:PAS domain S-box-containing protein
VPSIRKLPGAVWQGIVLISMPALILVALQIYTATGIVPGSWRSQALVAHTLRVIEAARALDQSMSETERGEFGYIVTGDQTYLDIYQNAARKTPQNLKRLRQLTADNPAQLPRIALLDSAVELKLTELQSAVEARQKSGFSAAYRLIKANLQPDTRRVITGLVELVIETEDKLLSAREAKFVALESRAENANTVGVALTVSLMLLGAILLGRALRHDARRLARLRDSEERFRLLVSGVKDYAIFMLDPEGRIVSWNEGARRIKGYGPHEAIGLHMSAFYPADGGNSTHMAEKELAVAEREGSSEAEGWRLRKDGSRFYANEVITALRTDDGSLRGFGIVTRDVTEKRAHEAALEESRSALAQAQKMEALGQLTGGLAHDFNNLLGVIIGGIDLAQRHADPANPEKSAQMLNAARQAAQQGAALVHRMLTFSRRQKLTLQVVDVNSLVRNMLELVRRTLGGQIRLECRLDPDLWPTRADPNQLESALLNLCVNARDAMENGGTLTIITGNIPRGDAVAVSSTGECVLLAVSDTGPGMDPDTVAHAFEPFYTTKPEGKGSGLGLSQVHGFAKQSGGGTEIESKAGEGTVVKIFLPRCVQESVDQKAPASAGARG